MLIIPSPKRLSEYLVALSVAPMLSLPLALGNDSRVSFQPPARNFLIALRLVPYYQGRLATGIATLFVLNHLLYF